MLPFKMLLASIFVLLHRYLPENISYLLQLRSVILLRYLSLSAKYKHFPTLYTEDRGVRDTAVSYPGEEQDKNVIERYEPCVKPTPHIFTVQTSIECQQK